MALVSILRTNQPTINPTPKRLRRDALLIDDPLNGVRVDLDFAFPEFAPVASPVAGGSLVKDIAELSNASVVVQAGGALPIITEGMLDFSTISKGATFLELPAGPTGLIYANNQNWLFCAYVRMPAANQWPSVENFAFLDFATGNGTMFTQPGLFEFRFIGNGAAPTPPRIQYRRQIQAGSTQELTVFGPFDAGFYGSLVQIACWRNASGQGVRLKTAASTDLRIAARNANNTQDGSAQKMRIGAGQWNSAALSAEQLLARNFRVGRVWLAAADLFTVDPVVALDADWARTMARNVFASGSAPVVAPTNTVLPEISGSPGLGSTLTVSSGTWAGNAPITYEYRMQRDGQDVGITSPNRVITAEDQGTALTWSVIATNSAGSSAPVFSPAINVPAASANTPPVNVVLPSLSGTPQVGQTMIAGTGTWSGTAPITFVYRAQRNGVNIAGAVTNTYVLTADDIGTSFRFRVTAGNVVANVFANTAAVNVTA